MKEKKSSSGLVWPYAISIGIILIVAASYLTIKVALQNPVEESDLFMRNYHDADANFNEIINKKIEFDKKYDVKLAESNLNMSDSTVAYKITDKAGKSIDNAKIQLILTRPDNKKSDIDLSQPKVNDGLYLFDNIKLPKEGRWDIMANISIGDLNRYINYKADTRNSDLIEY